MSRNAFHWGIDCVLLIGVVGLIHTGLTMTFFLPPGSGHASIWGLTRHDWGDIHFWIALSMAIVLLIHLSLHWTWLCLTTARHLFRQTALLLSPGRRLVVWCLLLSPVLLLGLSLLAAWYNIQPGSSGPQNRHHRRQHTQESSTLNPLPDEKSALPH